MKVIKPNKLSVLTRCFEHARQPRLGVSVLAFVPITEEDAPLLAEISMWRFAAERLGKEAMLDAGIPKCRGEFLIHGSAFAPNGEAVGQVPVRATVGELQKSLLVSGDRFWRGPRRASEARPFTRAALDWSRAYGGPSFAQNPLGRGADQVEVEGEQIQRLPNVELAEAQVESASQEVEPGGFGPIDLSWPQRQALAGSYDETWLETAYPGLADDVDWGFFNVAPRDQQRETFWDGGEGYCLENLHPTKPKLRGTLPRLTARAFVTRELEAPSAAERIARAKQRARAGSDSKPDARNSEPDASSPTLDATGSQADAPSSQTDATAPPDPAPDSWDEDGETCFEEVALTLQTLWFFPDAERAILVFQGSIPIATDDGADIRHLVVAAERQGIEHHRPVDHYAQALAERLDPKHGAMAALREHQLLPAGMDTPLDLLTAEEELVGTEGLLGANLYRRAVLTHASVVAELVAQGVDPAMHPEPPAPPEPPPTLEELPALAEKMLAEAERLQEEAETKTAALRDEVDLKVEAAGLDAAALREAQETPPTGPPTWSAEAQRAQLREAIGTCRASGTPAPAFEAMLADAELQASWDKAELDMRDGYRMSAHFQTPAPRRPADQTEAIQTAVLEALAAGEDFSTLDLCGADLSGMDLRAANLRGALLESATLDGADLRGADLSDAVLAHASLRGATLDQCTLRGTNLGKARLDDASLRGAEFDQTILHGADLRGADLCGARLTQTNLMQTVFEGADATGLEADGQTFLDTDLRGLVLHGAALVKATFVKMDLRGVDFTDADLRKCTFVGCELGAVCFSGADLSGACFVEACTLDEADFSSATMTACNLRGSSMRGCVLSEAQIERADLSECDLSAAQLYRIQGRGARFDKADLSGVNLQSANLMGASFLSAVIHGADLRGANLHGADMARVRSNAELQLDDAVLTRVRIHPLHTESTEAPDESR